LSIHRFDQLLYVPREVTQVQIKPNECFYSSSSRKLTASFLRIYCQCLLRYATALLSMKGRRRGISRAR